MGFYDPFRIQILAFTPYEQAHEWAHLEQHRHQFFLWRLWITCRSIPFFSGITLLSLEIQATMMALSELRACGALQIWDIGEAINGLSSYWRVIIPIRVSSRGAF